MTMKKKRIDAPASITRAPNVAGANKERTRFNDLVDLKKSDLISIADAARHIASRTIREHDSKATAIDRTRKHIRTIPEKHFSRHGKLLISEHLAFWAQQEWPDRFDDWASYPSDCVNVSVQARTSLSQTPPAFKSADEYLVYVSKLQASLEDCRVSLERYREDAEKYRASRAGKSEAGKQGGRGNIRKV